MEYKTAIIKSVSSNNIYNKKICGLYPLERNIRILFSIGFDKIYLDLSVEENNFYTKKIERHLKGLKDIIVKEKRDTEFTPEYLIIPSTLFTQSSYFSNLKKFFIKKKNIITPILNDDQFLLLNKIDYNKAIKLIKKNIIENTDGYIAKKINKKISLPISLLLTKTRIHPNILTIINMLIGIMSAALLLFNTYWHIVLGGAFFQLASVMDGVDGEVAKFTYKTTKIGGWLDTISDNLTLLLFLTATSYLSIINKGGLITSIYIVIIFLCFSTMLIIMIKYLKQHSKSASLLAYDKEFLQKLPHSDPLVAFIHNLKYMWRKEFFALFFFLICLTGKIHIIIISTAIALSLGTFALISMNIKYL
ncbi:MAG: CDP-alcohol phosphatidyltransferase family protein [Spirochaetota bacterium]|nr:CDP-alcohol phosphatidyltransferase family protein [Spirochaetota bacterium]